MDSNIPKLFKDFFAGGWVVVLIGAAGMTARMLSSRDEVIPVKTFISNIITAMLCSCIAWFIVEQWEISSIWKAIIYGLVGLNSPEIVKGLTTIGKAFASDPFYFINNLKDAVFPKYLKKKKK